MRRKTETQKAYHQAMKAEGRVVKKTSFREGKLWFYTSRILLIIVIGWLVSMGDGVLYGILDMFR